MSLFLAKKQEDLNQKKVRDLLRLKENKKCFDCPTKSPAFVNTTIQTFVCSRCSGLVREAGHRVKAVSASKFSGAELLALKHGGNGIALKIWLSNYSTHDSPEPESDADVRAFMRQKYFENKWLDRALLQSHKEKVRALIAKSFTEDGLPIVTKSRTKIIPGFSRVPLIADSEMNIMNDDDDEEEHQLEQVVVGPSISAPVIVVPQYNNAPPAYVLPPPTSPISPTGRASMESTYSSFSAKSAHSARSQPQEDYVSKHRRSGSSQRSVSSSRGSMDSTHFSAASTSTSSGASVLTAEEIAERCRSSIDSNSSQQNTNFIIEEEEAAPVEIEQPKASPSLQINVAQANKDFIQYKQQQQQQHHHHHHYQQQQRQHQQQLKSSTLVNFRNSIQSPTSFHGNSSASASPVVTPSTSKPLQQTSNNSTFDSILQELSGLKLEKEVRRATYTGGMLSPASVVTPLTPSTSKTNDQTKSRPTSMFDPSVFSQFNHAAKNTTTPENDPYAALRGIPSPAASVTKVEVEEPTKEEESKELDFPQDDDFEDDPWQEFCSSSSVDENEDITAPAQVVQPVLESKPMIAIDIFGDLDPRAMFKRF